MSLHSSVTSLNSLSESKKRRGAAGGAGAGNTYDIVAVKTKSSEIKPYEVKRILGCSHNGEFLGLKLC